MKAAETPQTPGPPPRHPHPHPRRGSRGSPLTSQDPGVGGYEGLHAEAAAAHRPAGSRFAPRPWPMPRPPGPGLRAELGGPGVGGRTAPTLERLWRGELGAHRPSRPEQQPKAGSRRRPLRSALGARRFITSQPGGRRGPGRGRRFHPARPSSPGSWRAAGRGRGRGPGAGGRAEGAGAWSWAPRGDPRLLGPDAEHVQSP